MVNKAKLEIIANEISISTYLYFLAILSSNKSSNKEVVSKVRIFYWAKTQGQARAGIASSTFIVKRIQGGLNQIDSSETATTLLTK